LDLEANTGRFVPEDKREIRLAVVMIGIALFVLGFIITLSTLSGNGTGTEEDASGNLLSERTGTGSLSVLMILGIVVSLAGVLIATVGPMASFMQNKVR